MLKRIIAVALTVLFVIGVFIGCRKQTAEQEGGAATSDVTSAPESTDTTSAETQPEELKPEDREPISFSTPGGAVIVGKIYREDGKWFMVPEQPLNIELTMFIEKTVDFDKLLRLEMLDGYEDGFEKSSYIGKTVTVKGELRIVRDDWEHLYLLPYDISVGKNVAECCAAPELEPPTEPENKYDASIPLPEKMTARTDNGHYVYNPYMLSIDALEMLGNGFADFYVDFIDAFLNYKTVVPCAEKDYAEMLNSVVYYEFPMFAADCDYTFIEDYNKEQKTITLHYSKSKAEHDKMISEFTQQINEFLKDIRPEQSEREKAQTAYHALCSVVKYDYDAMETRERIEAYYAFTAKTGICVTFANAYAQLLTQVGIDNEICAGTDNNDGAHAWNLVTIDGKNYFCDPTFELGQNNGKSYFYFGMNLAERLSDGTGAKGISIGKYSQKTPEEADISEESLPA